jgi:hypothetical protein
MSTKSKGQVEPLANPKFIFQDKNTKQNVSAQENIPEGSISLEELAGDIEKTQDQGTGKAKAAFPFDTLPQKAQKLITEANNTLGIPSDMLASSMLFAAASAAGNTVSIEVKKGEIQKAVFFMVQIGIPNTNKSGAVKFALKPLTEADHKNYEEYQAKKNAWDAEQAKPSIERDKIDKPIYEKHLISDATQEALATALQNSPRGLALYRDELAGWLKDFNRYNQGGDTEKVLSLWSLSELSVDRKASDTTIRIAHPFFSVIGTIQPGVLEELAKGGRQKNGFIDRFLFCWPEGLKKPEWTEKDIDPLLIQDYEAALNKLLGLPFNEEGKANKVTMTPEAKKQLLHFFNKVNKPLCDNSDNELLGGLHGKFDLHVIRLAVALHLIHWAYSTEQQFPLIMQTETITQAVKVGNYFRTQSLNVYYALNEGTPFDRLPKNKKAIYEALPETFSAKQGEEVAKAFKMPDRTFRHFLKTYEGILFEKPKTGNYRKIY